MHSPRPFVVALALFAGLGFGAAQAAPIAIVDLNAMKGTGPFGSEIDAAPVTISLAAGTYTFSVIDNLANGGYNGYNYDTGPTIRETFDVSINGGPVYAIDKSTSGFSSYASSAAAISAFASGPYGAYLYTPGSGASTFAGAVPSLDFTLTSQSDVTFAIPDNLFSDNKGGVSIAITAAVPEPETYALMLGGLGILGFVARRRKSV